MPGPAAKLKRLSNLKQSLRSFALRIFNSAGEECMALGLELVRGNPLNVFPMSGVGTGS